MGPTVVGGLPAHILLVHALLVFVPLSALLTVLHAAWPAAGRRFGVVTPLLALITLILVPITTNAGEWLQKQLPSNAAIERHVQLGDGLLPWVTGLFAVSLAVWWYARMTRATPPVFGDVRSDGARGRGVTAAVTLVALLVAGAAVFQLYRVGESGSKAVWGYVVEQQQAQ
ncbi:MAG: hypothetical protein JWM93_1912 [Frankiales bacterium]|nr:hypothetical protein [Frankiales bacterium]